jgi:polyisoprenyl-phosphate glycosyltransferase
MERTRRLISLVVPLFCEEDGVEEFHARAMSVIESLRDRYDVELIYVNDGSTDTTLEKLHQLARRNAEVRIISLSRNFGHQLAITAGIDHASGDAVVVIDGDLQDPPEVIPQMIAKWEEGYQVVYGVRRSRKGETIFKRATAKVFYRVMERVGDIKVPTDAGDFRLMDRRVVSALCSIREENRYIRGLVSWVGFRQTGIHYERDPRYAGVSKFSLFKMINFAWDGMTSFSERPLRVSAQLGGLVTISAVLLMVWVFVGKFVNPAQVVQGWTSTMLIVLFLGGVQLLSIGILGEYIGRIYRETKDRPLYLIAEKTGFDREPVTNEKADSLGLHPGL